MYCAFHHHRHLVLGLGHSVSKRTSDSILIIVQYIAKPLWCWNLENLIIIHGWNCFSVPCMDIPGLSLLVLLVKPFWCWNLENLSIIHGLNLILRRMHGYPRSLAPYVACCDSFLSFSLDTSWSSVETALHLGNCLWKLQPWDKIKRKQPIVLVNKGWVDRCVTDHINWRLYKSSSRVASVTCFWCCVIQGCVKSLYIQGFFTGCEKVTVVIASRHSEFWKYFLHMLKYTCNEVIRRYKVINFCV
jgi:hypothetical protein